MYITIHIIYDITYTSCMCMMNLQGGAAPGPEGKNGAGGSPSCHENARGSGS